MDKGYGKEALEIAINMKELTKLTRRMAMEFLLGQQGMFLKAIMKET